MTKTCKVCGVTSDVAEFYAGVNNRCKECHKASVRKNRAEKIEYYRAYDAFRYREDPKVRARHKRFAATEEGKASMKASRQKWLAENQEKRAAHVLLNNRVRDGKINKPKACEVCGDTNVRIEAHHEDYSRPLDVVWLCRSCHVREHREQSEYLTNLHEAAKNFDATPKPRGRHV